MSVRMVEKLERNYSMANDKSGFWEQTKILAQSAFKDIANSYQEILLQDSSITPNHRSMEEIEQSVHIEHEPVEPASPDIEPDR